jgi:hypothetical protein
MTGFLDGYGNELPSHPGVDQQHSVLSSGELGSTLGSSTAAPSSAYPNTVSMSHYVQHGNPHSHPDLYFNSGVYDYNFLQQQQQLQQLQQHQQQQSFGGALNEYQLYGNNRGVMNSTSGDNNMNLNMNSGYGHNGYGYTGNGMIQGFYGGIPGNFNVSQQLWNGHAGQSSNVAGMHVIHQHNIDRLVPYEGSYLSMNQKVGVYTRLERQERIQKFRLKKQNRIWKRQIKYDCRKRLADTRPRVKGRFVSSSDDVDVLGPVLMSSIAPAGDLNGSAESSHFDTDSLYRYADGATKSTDFSDKESDPGDGSGGHNAENISSEFVGGLKFGLGVISSAAPTVTPVGCIVSIKSPLSRDGASAGNNNTNVAEAKVQSIRETSGSIKREMMTPEQFLVALTSPVAARLTNEAGGTR